MRGSARGAGPTTGGEASRASTSVTAPILPPRPAHAGDLCTEVRLLGGSLAVQQPEPRQNVRSSTWNGGPRVQRGTSPQRALGGQARLPRVAGRGGAHLAEDGQCRGA